METIINMIVYPVLTAAVTGIIGWAGVMVKKAVEKFLNDKTKKQAAKECVQFVEQVYKTLHGQEKFDMCVEQLTLMLAEKGITITELEIRVLIESAVKELNIALKGALEAE